MMPGMTPIPIDDDLVPPGCKRYVIGPPEGHDITGPIRPVEAVAGIVDGQVRMTMLIALDDGEIDRLKVTPAIWLTMITNQLPPFEVHVADSGEVDPARILTDDDLFIARIALEFLAEAQGEASADLRRRADRVRAKIAAGAR